MLSSPLQARPEELILDHFISLCTLLDARGGTGEANGPTVAATDALIASVMSDDIVSPSDT